MRGRKREKSDRSLTWFVLITTNNIIIFMEIRIQNNNYIVLELRGDNV